MTQQINTGSRVIIRGAEFSDGQDHAGIYCGPAWPSQRPEADEWRDKHFVRLEQSVYTSDGHEMHFWMTTLDRIQPA